MERGEIKRKWGNLSPFPLHFLIFSPSPHSLSISSSNLYSLSISSQLGCKAAAGCATLVGKWFQILSEPRRSFLLGLSYHGRKSQKSPAQAIVEGGRLIKGKQEISAITTWRKNIHKMSFKMPCHRYYRLPQTGVWRSRREVLAVGSGQRPSNSSIMDQSRHLTRSPQCSASTPLPLKRGKTG